LVHGAEAPGAAAQNHQRHLRRRRHRGLLCCRTDGELLGSEAGAGGAKRLREMVGEFLINFRQQKRKQVIRGKKTYHIYDSLKLCIYGFIDLSIYRSTIYRSIYLHLSLFIFIAFICSY
jgi:hypothetical protein